MNFITFMPLHFNLTSISTPQEFCIVWNLAFLDKPLALIAMTPANLLWQQ